MCKQMQKGFTLIELMVVVAIVAILAAIAYPSYAQYSFRSRRADGREMVMRVAAAQERYYTNFNSYAPDLTALGFTTSAVTPTRPCAGTVGASERCFYTVTTANGASGTAQTFQLTATPVGIQATDACANLTRDDTGRNSYSGGETNGKCW